MTWSNTNPGPAGAMSDMVPNIRLTMGSTGGCDLTVNVSPAGSGTVNLMGGTYQAGTQLNLVAQANNGYLFDRWEGDASGSDPSTWITMDSNKTVTAFFKTIRNNLTISSTEGGSVVDPGEGNFTFNYGQQVSLLAQPETGYRFDRWTGDVSTMADYTSAATTIAIGGDYSITAEFIRLTSQLIINTRGEGHTMPAAGAHIYDRGARVEITAYPAAGYRFAGWTGDISGSLNPVAVTLDEDRTVTAVFIKTAPSVNEIILEPELYTGHQVEINGEYRGWESGHGSPPVTRSDWVLKDGTGYIYVNGSSGGMRHPEDIGRPVSVTGIVRVKNGVPYIEIPKR